MFKIILVFLMALVIAGCGKSAEQHLEVGLELHQQGRFEEAIQDYNEAILLDPQRVEAFNNRGRAYLNIDQAGKAIEDFDQVLRLDPQLAEAYYNRGLAYIKQTPMEVAFVQDHRPGHTESPRRN